MREIRRLVVSKTTGEAILTTEFTDDNADVAERFRQLKAGLPESGPGEEKYAQIRCDGCEYIAPVDFDRPEFPAGWIERPEGDFCPYCISSFGADI